MSDAAQRTSADTRERILDAAEALFAANGFDGTGVRAITGQAGVNPAAVSYHFGGKEGLIREVFRRRLHWLNTERLLRLDGLEAGAGGVPLKPVAIIDAFFGPALELAADTENGGHAFMQLLGRACADPVVFVRRFLAEGSAPMLERFRVALMRALPLVPEEEILWRLTFMLGATSFAIAGTDTLRVVSGLGASSSDPSALAPRLMSFLLGGMRAPLPA